VRGGEAEVGAHPGHGGGIDRLKRGGDVTEAAQGHRVDERLAAGEGRVEHRLGDAEVGGEAAHRDGGPAVGLGEAAGGADDLIASQVEVWSRSG
jgi:hypothetical protein